MHKILLKIGRSSIESKDFKKINWLRFMKKYQNVLYTVYTNYLVRIIIF